MNQLKPYIAFTDAGVLFLFVGILLATALFYYTIYFGLNRNRAYLWFATYSLFEALALLLLREELMLPFLAVFTLSCLCLLWFFLEFFDAMPSTAAVAYPAVLIVLPVGGVWFFDTLNETIVLVIAWLVYALTLMTCSWLSLRAYNCRRYGGRLLFYTMVLIFLLNMVLVTDAFFISSMSAASGLFILAVTYTVFQDIRKRNELMKSLRIRAVHLENEMLKTFIQPHFLLNTLTVLSEWIEEQPALAVKQINLLSKEFGYITRMSGKKLIPIEKELEICQVHLDIFNAKQESQFVLEIKNIVAGTQVPPMILHTLIENGLTHSEARRGRFLVEQQQSGTERIFRVSAEPLVEPLGDGEGLGLAYIKSRLEQTFPGRWSLSSQAQAQAWETLIMISI